MREKTNFPLPAMGRNPTEDEIIEMIAEVDDDGSGTIEFNEFLQVIENQKRLFALQTNEEQTVEAFVACGGNRDKSGTVKAEELINIVKEFGLTIDIETLIEEIDTDKSGTWHSCELGVAVMLI